MFPPRVGVNNVLSWLRRATFHSCFLVCLIYIFQWNLEFSIYTVVHNALQKECLKMYLVPTSDWAIKLEKKEQCLGHLYLRILCWFLCTVHWCEVKHRHMYMLIKLMYTHTHICTRKLVILFFSVLWNQYQTLLSIGSQAL